MFIYSVKASKVRAVLAVLVCAAVFAVFLSLAGTGSGDYPGDALTSVGNVDPSAFGGMKTTQDMIRLLETFGWSVEGEPVKIVQVTVPKSFDAVYEKYNQIQLAQGLDLTRHKGESARLFTYVVKNYDYQGTVYANLLISGERVIAGDICSADVSGFMHGLDKNNDFIS